MRKTPLAVAVFAAIATMTSASAQTIGWDRPDARGYYQDYYDSHPSQRGYSAGMAWGVTGPSWSIDPYGSAAIATQDRFIDPYSDR